MGILCHENAVVAVAEATGIHWRKTHPSKIEAARQLHKKGHLETDVTDLLAELNELRKDVQYGELGVGLAELNLEDLATELEGS